MAGLFNRIRFGDGLSVTDEGAGVIKVAAGGGSGGGIDFNKKNDTDAAGVDAGYLWLQFTGTPIPWSLGYGGPTNYGNLAYINKDTGIGGQVIQNSGGGVIALDNFGPGINASVMGSTVAKFDGGPSGGAGPFVSMFLRTSSSGSVGATWLKNEHGPIILETQGDVLLFRSSGHDINDVSVKISTVFNDFLIQGDQTVTRSGTGAITAITPSSPAFRVFPNSPTGIWMYNLPTSATGLTTGRVWNSSGVLHIV